MLFNSLDFLGFLPIVFAVYWSLKGSGLKFQNALLLLSSYFFYASWNYKFLALLIFSTLLDYFIGIRLFKADGQGKKRILLNISLVINLGFLAIFKYYNFFTQSFAEALSHAGFQVNFWTLKVILPVGISFYTFHGLSYILDIYKGKIEPEKNVVDYALFVSFFPLLVAGPIERATHLLPQLKRQRKFDYEKATDGLRQILWGFFKKLVIADNCALYVNQVFDNPPAYSGSSHVLAAILFSVQIYADFSGYSDIAIGTSRLFGINVVQNFNYPFFAQNIADFWRRWHMSLTSWFRDYLFIPLNISLRRFGKKGLVIAILIEFCLIGLWHGANWTYLMFGLIHGCYYIPEILLKNKRENSNLLISQKLFPGWTSIYKMTTTFILITIAYIFFRSPDLNTAFHYISKIFSFDTFTFSQRPPLLLLIHVVLFIMLEWNGRHCKYAIYDIAGVWPTVLRWSLYAFFIFYIGMYMTTSQSPFIYFQF